MQTLEATVISSKTPQTVSVVADYIFRHPKYKKILKRTTKLAAHNELPDVKVGDRVRLVKSRPYSKTKHFRVLEIIGRGAVVPEPEPKTAKTEPKAKTVKKVPKKA